MACCNTCNTKAHVLYVSGYGRQCISQDRKGPLRIIKQPSLTSVFVVALRAVNSQKSVPAVQHQFACVVLTMHYLRWRIQQVVM